MFRPGIVFFLILPPMVFLLGGVFLGISFWNPMSEALVQFIGDTFLSHWIPLDLLTGVLVFFALLLLLIPALIVVVSIFFSVFLVPRLVRVIQASEFKSVPLRPQGFHLESLWVTIKLSMIYLILVVVTFPINLLFPPLGILLNWWGLGYFNARLFSREILDEILPHSEVSPFFTSHRSRLTNASLVTAILYFAPLLNLLAPTWTAIVLTRICLGEYLLKNPSESLPS
jgi:hypothetical protein